MPQAQEQTTLDTFYHGRIKVIQPRSGYRFSIDAPLLADFVQTSPGDECLELGTGNGIIALLLSPKSFQHITAIEIQPALAELARRNIALNRMESKIKLIQADLKEYKPLQKYDIIFSNPPYIKAGTGRLSDSSEKSIARHEIHCTISDILEQTAAWLKPSGRAYFIYPEKRREEFLTEAAQNGLAPTIIRLIQSYADQPPNLFLVELSIKSSVKTEPAKMGTGSEGACPHFEGEDPAKRDRQNWGLAPKVPVPFLPDVQEVTHLHHAEYALPTEPPPLILYNVDGSWSSEARAIFAGR